MRARIVTPLHREMVRQGRMSKWLAAEIGSTESEISRWRHGLHVPEEATQARIAQALGCNICDVFPGDVNATVHVAVDERAKDAA